MGMATPGVWEGILKIIISFIALFNPPEPPAEGALPMYLAAQGEEMRFAEPVGFSIVENEYGTEDVLGTLTPADAVRFADFTERHLNQEDGFVVCDVELMAPVIRARIEGGQFLISSPDNNATLMGFLENGCP